MHILEKEGINPSTLGLLVFLKLIHMSDYNKQVVKEYLFDFTTNSGRKPHEILEESGYIKYIKGRKSDELWDRVRLSNKGEQIVKEMYHKPLNPLTDFTYDYLVKQYDRIGAEKRYYVGGDKIKFYISEFLYYKEQYTKDMIKSVIYTYIEDFTYDRKFLNKMNNLFFKPKNTYATKWLPEDCPLCAFIDSNQDQIRYNYKRLENAKIQMRDT